jgi:hypothetical protein
MKIKNELKHNWFSSFKENKSNPLNVDPSPRRRHTYYVSLYTATYETSPVLIPCPFVFVRCTATLKEV